MKISFGEFDLSRSGAIVVGVWEGGELTAPARQIDEASGGAVARAVAAAGRFRGKKRELLPIVAPAGIAASQIVLAGLGKRDEADARMLQDLGGALVAHLNTTGEKAATVAVDLGAALSGADAAAQVAFGAALRAYRFDRYRTTEKPERKPTLAKLTFAVAEPSAVKRAYRDLDAAAESVAFTRDLVSEPANVIYPETFAERAESLAELGLKVEVLDDDKLRKLGMGALLGVGQGSARPSRVVVMQWDGGADGAAPVAFVGKGVTFDTGGISIKPAAGMGEMKWDMAGAGVVIGLMRLLAARKAKVNAVGIAGLVENMPSATAQRPGDIVKSMSGQTIEVLNTDAEGRLVLADALWYCQDRFKPKLMVDLATLTGAVMVALGNEHAGLFSNNDELADRLLAAGKAVGEKLWRLPLAEAYDRLIDSDAADVKNISGDRGAGSIIGAQFIQRFVNKVPWAHLDIAGVAWSKRDAPTVPKGATAFGLRLLDRFVADYYEKELMAEIGFYHLLSTPLERALPRLLERARQQELRIVVRAGSAERVEHLNSLLWTYDEASFLAHGSQRDGNAADQPILLSHEDKNLNGATVLFLVDGVEAGDVGDFARCLDLFDGNDPDAVQAARNRWRAAQSAGHTLTYWQQTAGGWEKKA